MYKNLTRCTESDSPAACRNLARVIIVPETRCPNICSRRDRVAGAVVGGGAGAPLGGGGGGATVALDPGTGKDMLCFNSGLVGEPNQLIQFNYYNDFK